MGRKTKGGYYAVARGENVDVYSNWNDCKAQVDGFSNACYKKFDSAAEAQSFIKENSAGPTATTSYAASSYAASSYAPSSHAASSYAPSSYAASSYAPSSRAASSYAPSSYAPSSYAASSYAPSSRAASSYAASSYAPSSYAASSYPVENSAISSSTSKRAAEGLKRDGFAVDDEGYVIAFTDGACSKNGNKGAKAGIGVWFNDDHFLNVSEPVRGRQTNNTAEIQAAEKAISQAKEYGIDKLNIQTDSRFVIDCNTKWMNNWKGNGWKLADGEPVVNRTELEKLDAATTDMDIKWSYVAGHQGHYGNEAADRLAVEGANRD